MCCYYVCNAVCPFTTDSLGKNFDDASHPSDSDDDFDTINANFVRLQQSYNHIITYLIDNRRLSVLLRAVNQIPTN